MRNILNIVSIIVLAYSLTLKGQITEQDAGSFRMHTLKKMARRAIGTNNYYNAIEFNKAILQKDSSLFDAKYQLGVLYFKTRQYELSYGLLEEVANNFPDNYPLSGYYTGIINMYRQDYDTALFYLNIFYKISSGNEEIKIERRIAKNLIASCEIRISEQQKPRDNAIIENLDEINREHIEFAPFPLDDSMFVFGTVDSVNIDEEENSIRKLFVAKKQNGKWISTGKWDSVFNLNNINTGNPCISHDGNHAYFTRSFVNWKYQRISQIYIAEKTNGIWQEAKPLDYTINSDNFTSTMPALGINPKDSSDILYFVSDRPGGKGGMDIWYSTYDTRKDHFKEPKNVGTTINTPGDEITPFYDNENQTLYYSSNGNGGYGGFDVFKTLGAARKWTVSVLMGQPVNSSFDDQYFVLNCNKKTGYLTSNRPGSDLLFENTCCDDIYAFELIDENIIPSVGKVLHKIDPKLVDLINNKFKANIDFIPNGQPMDDVPVSLYLVEEGREFYLKTKKTKNGKYYFELEKEKLYIVKVQNSGMQEKEFKIQPTGPELDFIDTLPLQDTYIGYLPKITLRFNIYYETDEFKLTENNIMYLDSTVVEFLNYFPKAIIEVGSHTDNTGEREYNIKLSQKRADFVVKFLSMNGIDKERLTARGYGMEYPITVNENDDGTANDEGRKMNRRTEIKIIGYLNDYEQID